MTSTGKLSTVSTLAVYALKLKGFQRRLAQIRRKPAHEHKKGMYNARCF